MGEKTNEDPLKIFKKAVDNVSPTWRLSRGEWVVLPIKFQLRLELSRRIALSYSLDNQNAKASQDARWSKN